MSEQRETRNSLFKSSISINSIRTSATQFSKSLRRTSVIASQIEKTTRQRNILMREVYQRIMNILEKEEKI